MKIPQAPNQKIRGNLMTVLLSFSLVVWSVVNASALTVNLIDSQTEAALDGVGFRWIIEEDKTYHVPLRSDGTVKKDADAPKLDPKWRVGPDNRVGTADDDPLRNTLSVSFHQSYMPLVATSEDYSLDVLDAVLGNGRNYFISVLPNSGYSIGGAKFLGNAASVDIYLTPTVTPTAQISVFVFEDISPINNAWDTGERGLEGFSIVLEDAGGKYGASAGIELTDVYGNQLCTVYMPDLVLGGYLLDGDGAPIPDTSVGGAGCTTDADGRVLVKDLSPGKYGIITVAPTGSIWKQTTTIEGTVLIDAWVKANEPPFFAEFGPPSPHVAVGYVPASKNVTFNRLGTIPNLGGDPTPDIEGRVVNLHLSRPPDPTFWLGEPFPHTTPWVGLNQAAGAVAGSGVYAARANADGTFTIPSVPPGDYQLVIWDDNLDLIIDFKTVTVNTTNSCNALGGCNLGDVGVNQWFNRMEFDVFLDDNENGFWDPTEPELGIIAGLPEQNVNLRFRDGTIYQAFPTDGDGFAPFDQVFPFFHWMVAEVDFARFKATGATIVVDDGGEINVGDPWSFGDQLTPQVQGMPTDPDSAVVDTVSRTEIGPVLSQAFQGFAGQTSVIRWGKKAYLPGENGGISGVVMYAVTRAEDDPELAAAEPWEPGIPRVQVNLYEDKIDNTTLLAPGDGIADTVNGDGVPTYTDVDNYPFENFPGAEDVDRNSNNTFDLGDAIAVSTSDSWDDNLPANCQYGANDTDGIEGNEGNDPLSFRGVALDCYDGLRNWNQVRPGVFDGGYAFGPEFSIADDFAGTAPGWITVPDQAKPDVGYIATGGYIVEVSPPKGYKIIRSQDKNVDFGDQYVASPLALPAECVGDVYTVPAELSLFPGVTPVLVGQDLETCDRKKVNMVSGLSVPADFSLFTDVPIAGHISGAILDDLANTIDPDSPQFGEKYALPFMPVSIRDWTGREITRTLTDENGKYNALVPSTFTQNLPKPSGIAPNMLTSCMNSKLKSDGAGGTMVDPLHNPQYSEFCYTFQFVPGSTTYLDTPVIPVASFAGVDRNPPDCEPAAGTPKIKSVSFASNSVGGGPYIPAKNGEVTGNNKRRTVEISSMGVVSVTNPEYDGAGGVQPKIIPRDYGFGGTSGDVTIGGVSLLIDKWNNNIIKARIPSGTNFGDNGGQQLIVTHNDGPQTITGITVQVGLRPASNVLTVTPGSLIQDAIDSAAPNDLILVAPGTYDEMVIMWKPVQLQGWGEGSTSISAVKTPFEKLADWRTLAEGLVADGSIDLIPGQGAPVGGVDPIDLFSEEGAGVLVATHKSGVNAFQRSRNRGARVDGFTISGASSGGGLIVNGFVDYLDVSNLKITNNHGFYAGGIRVGQPAVESDASNNYINIHHNSVVQNGGLAEAGGGIALHTGADSYAVTNNFVCGNFTTADGAGIAHYGLSDNNGEIDDQDPIIAYNTILFNENFNQGLPTSGGGILISGKPPLNETDPSPGSGSVDIIGNLIQGNSAGAGDGGGIQLSWINGAEIVTDDSGNFVSGNTINIINNIIVNNEAALAGGGISMLDALDVHILHNTIAHNDNVSTAGVAFGPGLPTASTPQPGAGIVSRANLNLPAVLSPTFSEPAELANNIVWENRTFSWVSQNGTTGLCPDIGDTLGLGCADNNPVFDDLAVTGTAGSLDCTDCVVSGGVDPQFVAGASNGNRSVTTFVNPPVTPMTVPPALDEGGNFIRLSFGPLTQTRDYHILAQTDPAGVSVGVTDDFDLDARTAPDYSAGADEF